MQKGLVATLDGRAGAARFLQLDGDELTAGEEGGILFQAMEVYLHNQLLAGAAEESNVYALYTLQNVLLNSVRPLPCGARWNGCLQALLEWLHHRLEAGEANPEAPLPLLLLDAVLLTSWLALHKGVGSVLLKGAEPTELLVRATAFYLAYLFASPHLEAVALVATSAVLLAETVVEILVAQPPHPFAACADLAPLRKQVLLCRQTALRDARAAQLPEVAPLCRALETLEPLF